MASVLYETETASLRENLGTPPGFSEIRVAHVIFLCFALLSLSCVLRTQCCQCLWIVNYWLSLWSSHCLFNQAQASDQFLATNKLATNKEICLKTKKIYESKMYF